MPWSWKALVCLLVSGTAAIAIEQIDVPAQALGKHSAEAWIHLPATLEEGQRYPVIYLLHSFSGNAQEWTQLGIQEAAKDLPLILVMSDGEQDFFGNFPKRPAWESYLLKNVIPHIDSSYPTIATPAGRGLLGLSMGGHAALRLTLAWPETFSVCGSISGLLGSFSEAVNSQVQDQVDLLTQSVPDAKLWDVQHLLRTHSPTPKQAYFIECGAGDPWLAAHRSWVHEASKRGLRYEYRESPGRHDYAYWRSCVRELLPKLSGRLSQHAVVAERELAWQPLLGEWHSFAVVPQGGELKFETVFEIQKGQLSGQSKGNEGEQRFDRIAFDEGSLTYRTYQDERIVDVRAHMAKDGKLEGEWSIADGSGKTVASGEWRAERQR